MQATSEYGSRSRSRDQSGAPGRWVVPRACREEAMHPLHVGTCGWSYKEWSGVFYPKDLPAADYLASYADRYPVVEVDSTFYGTPARKTVEGWRERTPAGFGFSLKVPQVITHEKVLRDCQGELGSFLTAARLLGDKLLCCLLQFGYFNRGQFANVSAFLERLDPFLAAWPGNVPVAVEVRNKTWMTLQLGECLRGHGPDPGADSPVAGTAEVLAGSERGKAVAGQPRRSLSDANRRLPFAIPRCGGNGVGNEDWAPRRVL
jgi:Protein of unknown function DUF72